MALAHGIQERSVPLVVQNRLSVKDAFSVTSHVLGKGIKITVVGREVTVEGMQQRGTSRVSCQVIC